MKLLISRYRNTAMTRPELLVVMVGLLVLVFAVVLPSLPTRDRRSRRSVCASNLKQLGLAAKTWSLDNGGRFPWQVSTNEGGTLEIAASPAVFRHFLAMSNQVEEPKILVCPVDKDRQRSAAFAKGFTNSNLSYFVGLDSDELHPESILSGDRNLVGESIDGSLLIVTSNALPRWTSGLHGHFGNLVLSDGSLHALSDEGLATQFCIDLQTQTSSAVRLAIPHTAQDALEGNSAETSRQWLMPWVVAGLAMASMFGGGWVLRRRLHVEAVDRRGSS